MDGTLVIHVGRRMMETAIMLAGPALIATLVIGFVVAMLQAVTSIRDMTLGMVLKLICVGVTLMICGGWMMQTALGFATEVFNHMQSLGQ